MKNRKQNPYLIAGLLLNAGFLLSNQLLSDFELLKGILAGCSIGLLLLGVYYGKYGKMPFAKEKEALLKRFNGR